MVWWGLEEELGGFLPTAGSHVEYGAADGSTGLADTDWVQFLSQPLIAG